MPKHGFLFSETVWIWHFASRYLRAADHQNKCLARVSLAVHETKQRTLPSLDQKKMVGLLFLFGFMGQTRMASQPFLPRWHQSEKNGNFWKKWRRRFAAPDTIGTDQQHIKDHTQYICVIWHNYSLIRWMEIFQINVWQTETLCGRTRATILNGSTFAANNTMRAWMVMNSCSRLKMKYVHILIPREIFWIQHRNLFKSIEFEDYASIDFTLRIVMNHLCGEIYSLRKFEAFRK